MTDKSACELLVQLEEDPQCAVPYLVILGILECVRALSNEEL